MRRKKGEGSITQRPDGRYMGQITTGKDPLTGKPNRETVYGETAGEVQRKLDDLRSKKSSGSNGNTGQTVKVFLHFWLASIKSNVSSRTYYIYERIANKNIIPHIGGVNVNELSAMEIVKLYQRLGEDGQTQSQLRYTAKVLRMSFHAGVRLGLLATNVAAKLPLPKAKRFDAAPLELAQAKALIAAARTDRLYTICVLALDSGLRVGELLALEWADVDFAINTIRVSKAIKIVKGKIVTEECKTAASRRRVRVSGSTMLALKEHKEAMRQEGHNSNIVFCTQKGTHYWTATFYHRWNRLRKFAGFPKLRFHDLRHTSATHLLLRGVNAKAVSARLGHASVIITLSVYAHVIPGMEDQIVGITEEFMQ